MKEYSKELKEIVKYLSHNCKIIHSNYNIVKPYIFLIEKETSWLSKDLIFTERIYCIKNDMFSRPVCQYCKEKEVSFKNLRDGYENFCSMSCCIKHLFENMSQKQKDEIAERKRKKWKNMTAEELMNVQKKRLKSLKITLKNELPKKQNKL